MRGMCVVERASERAREAPPRAYRTRTPLCGASSFEPATYNSSFMARKLATPRRAPRDLDRLFRPRAVAVIGASRRPGSIGWQVLHNLVTGGFEGKVFPVNPHADVLHSIKCHSSVAAIPDAVDLAIVTVPKALVPPS